VIAGGGPAGRVRMCQRLPLQFATALQGALQKLIDPDELAEVLEEAEAELADPGRWGLPSPSSRLGGSGRPSPTP
jgi:hypothetical protein